MSMEIQIAKLGKIVQQARKDKNWTIGFMAKMSGLSAGAISKLEKGESKFIHNDTLSSIDKIFEWEPNTSRTILYGESLVERQDQEQEGPQTFVVGGKEYIILPIEQYKELHDVFVASKAR